MCVCVGVCVCVCVGVCWSHYLSCRYSRHGVIMYVHVYMMYLWNNNYRVLFIHYTDCSQNVTMLTLSLLSLSLTLSLHSSGTGFGSRNPLCAFLMNHLRQNNMSS